MILLFASCTFESSREWVDDDGYRWAELSPGWWGKTGFEKIDSGHSHITFANRVPDDLIADNQILLNGSGVAAADVDADGLVDLYFASLDGPNKLYKNLGGFRFKDITDDAGVAHTGFRSTGVAFADVNGNGHPDLIITSLDHQNSLYLNDGNGTFNLHTESGLEAGRGSKTIAVADINGNGYLDLYITNYKQKSAKDIFGLKNLTLQNITRKTGDRYELVPPYDEHFVLFPNDNKPPDFREKGEMDELYVNNGDGTFSKISDLGSHFLNSDGNAKGLTHGWGLTAKFQDINGDMHPDLYVSNDFWTPDKVWINRGDGIFQEIVNHTIRNFSFSSMSVDFSDINRDGHTDIFVTEMLSPQHERRLQQQISFDPFQDKVTDSDYRPLYSRNSLYLNRGNATFSEIAHYSGTAATEWSWATRFLDVDLDGYEDILINTGFSHDIQDLDAQRMLGQQMARRAGDFKGYVLEFPPLLLPNKALRNNGDMTFSDKSSEWGFTDEDVSHGMAVADLDNDGDPDIVINRFNEEAAVYENSSTAPRIAVRLRGEGGNSLGIGASVELSRGELPDQNKEMALGGDYLSSSEPMIVFAADKNGEHRLKVRWPSGKISRIDGVKSNRIYEIHESGAGEPGEETPVTLNEDFKIQFEDVSDRIDHKHESNHIDDFELQPLLPFQLSRTGPATGWFDFTGNGSDDMYVTSGKNEALSIFKNQGDGTFQRESQYNAENTGNSEIKTVIAWHEKGRTRLISGLSEFDMAQPDSFRFIIQDETGKNGSETDIIHRDDAAMETLAAGDYSGNGYPDLFVGGSYRPGRYPEPVSSYLYINDEGTFRPDTENSEILNESGPVTGAIFFDFENDGDQDLLLSTYWGALGLFRNENGRFTEITADAGLDQYKGWWNGIAVGDFNNDGLPDIVAANLGLNSPYRAESGKSLKMFYNDFNLDGVVDIIEAYAHPEKEGWVPRRMLNDFASIPEVVLRNVRSHRDFATSTLQEILGYSPDEIWSREINTLEHTLFLNRGGEFTARALPEYSQFTIANLPVVADFDNDGFEDIFLSQNFFGFPAHVPRQDGGRGLILRGDGEGNFEPVPGHKSGIRVYGEQMSASVSDFNQDGKTDLAVAQTGSDTKLYLNRSPNTGIRVELAGPDSNPDGIGSRIRIKYKNGTAGPARYLTGGSGFSQNSTRQVLGVEPEPAELEIIWFDGTRQTVALTEDRMDYRVKTEN